ncbi:MAG: mechanosensitive ion channel [Hyphomonadaceae bacterium]|nr:mechanosensitive ion channel [Hyphomonadaceae bacterium]
MQEELNRIAHLELVRIGGAVITVGGVAGAVVMTTLFLVASYLVGAAVRRVRLRVGQPGGAAALYVVEKFLTYGLVAFGLMTGLSSLGIDLSSFTIFAGALGIGLGFGLQGVLREFVSGLVLLFDRQIHIGDYLEMPDGTRGVVQEIGPRATRIRNNDNVYLLVPNSKLIDNTVINWTLRGESRRIHVPFVVALGADKERVRDAVLEAARDVPFTLPETSTRRTQVWLVGYGDGVLKFELVVWPTLEAVKRPKAMNAAYTWAIDDALRKAGVEIPYPQREIRVRSFFGEEGEDALDALNLQRTRRAPVQTPTASINDAAEDLLQPEPDAEPKPEQLEAGRS